MTRNNRMGRRRKAYSWLPPYVYPDKTRFVYRPRKDGKADSKGIKLCPITATPDVVWNAYKTLIQQDRPGTLTWLCDQYFDSARFRELAPRTQDDYRAYYHKIISFRLKDGKVFGDVPYDSLTPGVGRRYLDSRKAKVRANRELAFLSLVYSWAYERELVKANPFKGVRRNRETPASQYVDGERFAAAYQLAVSYAPWYVPVFMVIATACRARKIEVLTMLKSDATNSEGVFMRRRKRSKDNIIERSPMLQHAIDTALARPCDVKSLYLLHDDAGQPIPVATLNSAWGRLMREHVIPAGIKRFRLHDLKVKGVSDDLGNWMDGSGHRSPGMGNVYRVKPITVKSSI